MKLFAIAILAAVSASTTAQTLRVPQTGGPSGNYAGSVKKLGETVQFSGVVHDDTSTFDIDIHASGLEKVDISCPGEKYVLAADGQTVTLPNVKATGNCIHDALQKNNIQLKGVKYDPKKDTITVSVHAVILNLDIVAKHVGMNDNPSVIEGHCSGWKCIYDMGRGGCDRYSGFNLTMTMPGGAGHGQLTIPVGVIPWDTGAPQCQPGSDPWSCNLLVRGSWNFGNFSDVYTGNVVQPHPDGVTDVQISYNHQIPQNGFVLSFEGQAGAHAGMTMNCSMAF